MRVLVLGANGMLGHQLCRGFDGRFETWGSFRGSADQYARYALLDARRAIGGVAAEDVGTVEAALDRARPDAVVNCIGIVKQRDEAKMAVPSIVVNCLFPHRLAEMCIARDARLIHMSTDCVFSGRSGAYAEADTPDPVDLYGRSKLLGEVDQPGCLTFRTSIIGWELEHRAGLLEWFAAQRGRTIKGYRRALYSGVSTRVMADLIGRALERWPELSGVYHAASEPIDKCELLSELGLALGWDDIVIEPEEDFVCDRSLDGSRLVERTGWSAPSWAEMIRGLAAEWPTYEH